MLRNTSLALAGLLISFLLYANGVAAASVAASSASQASRIEPTATPKDVNDRQSDEVLVLRTQVAEMRRSEDRILATVHWALGGVFTIAVGLAAFSWWTSNKLHQQDLSRLREELLRQLAEAQSASLSDIKSNLDREQVGHRNQLQAEMIAHTMWQIGKLRLQSGDIQGTITAAIEQASAAKIGNANYLLHALLLLTEAVERANLEAITLDKDIISTIKRLVIDSGDPLGKHATALTKAIAGNQR
jgi:hypothetical protein